jgi:hypothetical protein
MIEHEESVESISLGKAIHKGHPEISPCERVVSLLITISRHRTDKINSLSSHRRRGRKIYHPKAWRNKDTIVRPNLITTH